MGDWKARVVDAYFSLGDRDRLVVNWGGPVIFLLVLYLIVGRPMVNSYLQLADTHDQLHSNLVWLMGQGEHLERINSYCSLAIDPVTTEDAEFVITGQARRLGLEPDFRTAPGSEIQLEFNAVLGNAVLTLARELACRGLAVTRLEMDSSASDNGLVDATLALQLL